jgi:biopolymer transport protein ExbD
MVISTASSESKSYSDINMTPLIDVMLVLLIIFIITIPAQTDAVKIENPSPRDASLPLLPVEAIDLLIDFDGTLTWNRAPVDRTTIQGYMSRAASLHPQPAVHLLVNKFSRYEVVAQTLADLQHRGLNKIGFLNNDIY